MKFLILHSSGTGNLFAINAECIEAIGTNSNGVTFIMPKLGNEEQVYLVVETVDEILGLLADFGAEMRILGEEEINE